MSKKQKSSKNTRSSHYRQGDRVDRVVKNGGHYKKD